jgi:anthranilate synthase/aminodeoxychorismate synthase-like glutamine amidotransferase
MVLLIDNYDSFTYNLKQEIEVLGLQCKVYRNDEISLEQIRSLKPAQIVISPGPGNPDSAGVTLSLIRAFSAQIPILGVCLGHQSIAQALGGRVIKASAPMHGKVSKINHTGVGVFSGLLSPIEVARYHSLIVEKESLPAELTITALSESGEIMALRSESLKLEGVQFHPESVATDQGRKMLASFFGLTLRTP